MSHVHHFSEIGDFLKTSNLNIENSRSDFLIYDYEKANCDDFADLSSYRQNYFEVNLDLDVGCSIKVDQFDLPSEGNRLTLISPNRLQSINFTGSNNGSHRGYGMFFSSEFIQTNLGNSNFIREFPFFNSLNSPVVSLEIDQIANFKDLFLRIQYEYNNFGEYSRDVIQNYLNILFLKAKGNYKNTNENLPPLNREQEIYHAFENLIQKYYLSLRSVKDYAEKIHVSPKHLSETVKKVSGRSALQIIHQAKLNHAKSLLMQTGKSVSEIAYDLNFENADYFSIFFKRETGKSPSKFRVS